LVFFTKKWSAQSALGKWIWIAIRAWNLINNDGGVQKKGVRAKFQFEKVSLSLSPPLSLSLHSFIIFWFLQILFLKMQTCLSQMDCLSFILFFIFQRIHMSKGKRWLASEWTLFPLGMSKWRTDVLNFLITVLCELVFLSFFSFFPFFPSFFLFFLSFLSFFSFFLLNIMTFMKYLFINMKYICIHNIILILQLILLRYL
jgi:hypothetical protein